jgi:hypothetical protein
VSRKPLRLVNSYAFSKSATVLPDQWLHFASLRPTSKGFVALLATFLLVSVWGFFGMIEQRDVIGSVMGVFVAAGLMAAGALTFGFFLIRTLLANNTRVGWPNVIGLGIGKSGIALRVTSGDTDIAWDDIESIDATFSNLDDPNPKQAHVPILQITYTGTHEGTSGVRLMRQIPVDDLDASPPVVYRALVYYWTTPVSRDELGTAAAQKQLDVWLADLLKGARTSTV